MVSATLALAAVPSFSQWMTQQGKSYATREELVLRRVSDANCWAGNGRVCLLG
jgi:hypothetical protein